MVQSLSDILSSLSSGGQSVLPQAPVPPPIDPTGATVLPAASPGNVLARLQQHAATPAPAPRIFSETPDVRGLDKGSAFAAGLSGALADNSKSALLASQQRAQQDQTNLALYKTVSEEQHQQATLDQQKNRDAALDRFYAAQIQAMSPEAKGAAAKAVAEGSERDVENTISDRKKMMAAAGIDPASPQGVHFMATGNDMSASPTKYRPPKRRNT